MMLISEPKDYYSSTTFRHYNYTVSPSGTNTQMRRSQMLKPKYNNNESR